MGSALATWPPLDRTSIHVMPTTDATLSQPSRSTLHLPSKVALLAGVTGRDGTSLAAQIIKSWSRASELLERRTA